MTQNSVENIEIQFQSFQEFINLIQDKQLQDSLRLSKTKSIKLDNKTYTKKSLTARQFAEISKLYRKLDPQKTDDAQIDIFIELRTKSALYYYGISPEVFDKNFEKLNPILDGCVLVTSSGISPDIDIDRLLLEYRDRQNKK